MQTRDSLNLLFRFNALSQISEGSSGEKSDSFIKRCKKPIIDFYAGNNFRAVENQRSRLSRKASSYQFFQLNLKSQISEGTFRGKKTRTDKKLKTGLFRESFTLT